MKRLMLLIMLGGLLLAVTGCSSGGGGGGGNNGNGNNGEPVGSINVAVPGTYPINSSYQITKSGATIKLTLQSIQVTSDHKLKLNCIWLAQSNSVNIEVDKESDSGNTRMYLKDNTGRVYGHYQGEGAAYTKVTLPIGASTTGAFYFYALNNTAESITFYDDNQNQRIGPIIVNR